MKDLDFLFYPKSIAIIGASRDPDSVGNNILKNLVNQGFKGEIFPVNPKAENLYRKKVYKDVDDLNNFDLAIVAVPARFVTEVVKKTVKKAKAMIVVSSGFKESGQGNIEEELKEICSSAQVPLVGPNCLGVINPEIKMNASFANVMPKLGNIAFVSQSGALCTTVIDYAQDLGLGFSKFISIGNKAGAQEFDLIEYLANDQQTKLIAVYSEELSGGSNLINLSRSVTRGDNPKPIIILKAGKTDLGAKTVMSHTGSLSGKNEIYDALFNQSGMIRAQSIQDFFNYIQIFSKNGLVKAQNIAVITNAGGPGVIATDAISDSGLSLAKLSLKTKEKLREVLPPAACTDNPVDILGDARTDRYKQTLEIVSKNKDTDALLVLLTPQSMTEIDGTAIAIVEIKEKTAKPIVTCFMGKSTVEPGIKLLKSSKVISMNFPETAIKNLAAYSRFYRWSRESEDLFGEFKDVKRREVEEIFKKARVKNQTVFSEAEALAILKAYNFPILKYGIATSSGEAEEIAKEIGGAVAMKIVSPDILHKSDVGGVVLSVDQRRAGEEYRKMLKSVSSKIPKAKIEGVLIEEMAPKGGVETILGASKDSLGIAIMFGLGGIYTEVFKDVCFGIVPISKNDAQRMMNNLKASKIFAGFRGSPALDIGAVIDSLGRLSRLLSDFPEIKELDINPLLVLPKGRGAKVLDTRIIIE